VKRREMMAGTALGTLMLAGLAALAESAAIAATPAAGKPAPNPGLADAATDCVRKAEDCLPHCLNMLSTGDTTLAACAQSVRETMAVCQATAALAASGSKHLSDLAKVCADICKDCEAECRKHADKHQICKDCADACAKTAQACAKA
jgi:Cys-rich four helix bundle protein (predicted Tat secretion target)